MSATNNDFGDWMAEAAGITGARLGDRLSGGNANVTRIIESDQGRFVLRHPPAETVSDKAAAGIEREYRVASAIGAAAPVPRAIAFCADRDVIGAPFMVSEFVDGVAITETLPDAYADEAGTVSMIGEALVDALSTIHRIDWRSTLGEDFARPDGFIARQVDRWTKVRARDTVRELPLLEELAAWLRTNAPAPVSPSIVHCDYHLDNTLFDRSEPRLRAVIDWEMATIADPRVDLGLLLMFWNRDPVADLGFRFVQRVSNRPGVVPADDLAARWSAVTGISVTDLDYFRVFAFWRLAAIVEGAYVLQCRGAVDSTYARGLEQDVPNLLREAAELLS
jgi:aminoglycoside phosphotransferase (APT) family kinase protein